DLPGGVMKPDKLRQNNEALEFVRAFHESGKPIGAICHGPQVVIDAGIVRGKGMTSYPAIRTDLVNAGANWVDREVVTDQGLVTSRAPADLDAFNAKLLEEIGEGIHEERIPCTLYFSIVSIQACAIKLAPARLGCTPSGVQ